MAESEERKALVEEIKELSDKLDTKVTAKVLNAESDEELQTRVENLREGVALQAKEAAKDDRKTKAVEDSKKAVEDANAEVERPPFYVEDGKAITTRSRGIRSDGEDVTAEDFGPGEEALMYLVEKGYVIERG